MKESLRSRKQELVSTAIYDAAIELFAEHGFDDTTVEDIAQAAGVSKRSFFRYFATKDHLLGQSVVSYGAVLANAIRTSPDPATALQMIRITTAAGVEYSVANELRLRQVVDIAARSASARQAQGSRMMHVEDMLSDVVAERFAGTKGQTIQPRLMAGIALAVMSSTILGWYRGEFKDIPTSAQRVLQDLTLAFVEPVTSDKGEENGQSRSKTVSPAKPRSSATKQTPKKT